MKFTSKYFGIALIASLCAIGSTSAMQRLAAAGRSVARNAVVPILPTNPARSLSTSVQRIVLNRQLEGLTVRSPLLRQSGITRALSSVPALYVFQQKLRFSSDQKATKSEILKDCLELLLNVAYLSAMLFFVDKFLCQLYGDEIKQTCRNGKDKLFLWTHPLIAELVTLLAKAVATQKELSDLQDNLKRKEVPTNAEANTVLLLGQKIAALKQETESLWKKLFENIAKKAPLNPTERIKYCQKILGQLQHVQDILQRKSGEYSIDRKIVDQINNKMAKFLGFTSIKILASAALIDQQFESRKQEYIKGIKNLASFGYQPFIVDSCAKSPRSFFGDYIPESKVLYAATNDPTKRNKGVNEARGMLKALNHFKFNDNDTIVKVTGRYYLISGQFLKLVENNPDAIAIFRRLPYGQIYFGCFAMKCKFFKEMLQQLNLEEMEQKNIDIEIAGAQYVKALESRGHKIIYVDNVDQVAPWFYTGNRQILQF